MFGHLREPLYNIASYSEGCMSNQDERIVSWPSFGKAYVTFLKGLWSPSYTKLRLNRVGPVRKNISLYVHMTGDHLSESDDG